MARPGCPYIDDMAHGPVEEDLEDQEYSRMVFRLSESGGKKLDPHSSRW